MNFIQTLHINSDKDPFVDPFGWIAPEYHLMGWALSCLQLHKLYGSVTLYANSRAAHLLADTLNFPYREVHLVHDRLRLIHPDLWALPKIYTYSLQEQPFLHVDGDVFLFETFGSSLLEGELIAQNIEVATDYYISTQRELMRHFTFFPPCVKKDFESEMPFHAANAGILGGYNMSFFRDYAAMAFEYINKNTNNLKHINVNGFNVFFEQHLFYASAREKGCTVKVLFEDIINDNGYTHLGDFHDVPFNRNYLHLLGHFKRDEFTCIQMAAKLKELYPDYYEQIIALFHKKNISLSPCGFNNDNVRTIKATDEQSNTHLQLLRSIANNCPADIEKDLFQNDFECFYSQLISILKKNIVISNLHKRDLSAQHWYRDLFADTSQVLNENLIRCQEATVIESSFNWAELFNKHYRIGVDYYNNIQINRGEFYNLIVFEASDNGFSLYDMSELDYVIFQLLYTPLSIRKLLVKMQDCFEEDVVQNHYQLFENLIFISIKQLVINKAIQPFYS